jgi:hypothetical protein
MMNAVRLLPLILILVACANPPADNGSGEPTDDDAASPTSALNLTHSPEEARGFIRRFDALRVGLVNYFNPTKVELINREFAADTVVFRLNSTGDTGPFHEAAVDIAAEMAEYHWTDTTASQETIVESHLALVHVESIGIPTNARAGDTIPVRIKLKGNATDIHGGYVYNTPLTNKLGVKVAELKEGYLPFDIKRMDPKDVTDEQRRDASNLEERQSAAGNWFILRNGAKLAQDVHESDLTSDQIILPLERVIYDAAGQVAKTVRVLTSDIAPYVAEDIARQMEAAGMPVKVEYEPGKFIITPLGVREETLGQVYDRIRELTVEIRPKNRMIIIFDDALFRVAIYGPVAQRFLIDNIALTSDPFSRSDPKLPPYQLPFRVSCRVLRRAEPGQSGKFGIPDRDDIARGFVPDGHKGRVRLAWSRWEEGKVIDEDTEELPTSDISDILRHLWVRGMGPREVLAFVKEADDSLAINAELGYNHQKIDLDKLKEGRE